MTLLAGNGINDVAIADDADNFNRLTVKQPAESLSVLDDGGKWSIFDMQMTANIVTLDELVKKLFGTRVIVLSEGVSTIDELIFGRTRGRTSGEAAVVGDSTIVSRNRGRTTSEVTTTSDATLAYRQRNGQISEALTLVDSATANRSGPGGIITESVSVSDSGVLRLWDVLMTAAVSVTDQTISSIVSGSGGTIVVKIASDVLLVTDGTISVVLKNRSLSETVTVSEAGLGSTTNVTADVTDSLTISDETLRRRLSTIVTSDGVTLLDLLVSSAASNRTLTATDAIIVSEQVVRGTLRNRLTSDVSLISDGTVSALQRNRFLIEASTMFDEMLSVRRYTRSVEDDLTLTDQQISTAVQAVLYAVRIIFGLELGPIIGMEKDQIVVGRENSIIIGVDR